MSEQGDLERFRRLQLVTDAALSHLELDAMLEELLSRVRDALEVDTVAILMLDDEAGELVAHAALGIEEEVERGVRVPLGRGFAGRVAADRQPIVLADVDHADVLNPILREKGIKSLLGVPLLLEGSVIGVLHVGSLVPRAFDERDVELLQLVADRVATGIEHARLFEAERRARRKLERVQLVTDVALAHLDLEELLWELLRRIRDILAADTAAILLHDPATDELVARAALGIEEEVEQGVRIPVGRGFAGRVAAERRPVILPDLDRADIVNPILREKGLKSMVGVPLLAENHVIGVLHVGSLVSRNFTDDDVELLQVVADRAAMAIERARIHEELRRVDQLKLNFVAVASHELRTPAASVYGIVATLRQRGDVLSDEVRAELEDMLWDQAIRLRRLIEQLLDLSRLDSQSIEIHREPLVLQPLVRDVATSVADAAELDVDVLIEPSFAVLADRLALERILTNLLANAFRYGKPPVVVSADHRDRHLRIVVEDAGEGVPEELVPRLFERFERGYAGHGTGLGLAIAKAYANAHGGDLVYENGARGGARFELILPA
ncbi:MAG TPA: GAF domain-containing protein [Gaiellaceae bacterium]|nr:GAF domain-containing protein [Gaiellaceae bacterium]